MVLNLIRSKSFPSLVFFETDDGRKGRTWRYVAGKERGVDDLLNTARYQLSITDDELVDMEIHQLSV